MKLPERVWPLLATIALATFFPSRSASAQDPEAADGKRTTAVSGDPQHLNFVKRRISPSLRETPTIEKSVLDALRWLIRHQREDGSWSSSGLAARCRTSPTCCVPGEDSGGDVGTTALALACFTGAGFSPWSRQDIVDTTMSERHRIGEVIGRGVNWLVRKQAADGSWPPSPSMLENQALATLVLAEAYDISRDPQLQAPAQQAVDALLRAQLANPSGEGRWGWRRSTAVDSVMSSTEPADIAATAWAVRALRSARRARLEVNEQAFVGAAAFSDSEWSRLSSSSAAEPSLTTLAWLRLLARPSPSDPALKLAGEQIVADVEAAGAKQRTVDARTAYEQSSVMTQVHGQASTIRDSATWKRWNDVVPPALVAAQDRTQKSCRNGGWLQSGSAPVAAGPVASTALTTLALESNYGFESIFAAPK